MDVRPLRRVTGTRLNTYGAEVEVLECGHESYATINGTSQPFAESRRCFWCGLDNERIRQAAERQQADIANGFEPAVEGDW